MIILGAGGHAKELYNELLWSSFTGPVYFFDDTVHAPDSLFGQKIIPAMEPANVLKMEDNRFIVGVGLPSSRKIMFDRFLAAGFEPYSLISSYARVGAANQLGRGLNIMAGAVITTHVTIGDGTLVHVNTSVHHDCVIGAFCELSPGCRILGKVKLGDSVSVGSGAIILPGVQVGNNVTVGAGAVVTRNLEQGEVVAGVPARAMKQ